MVVDKVFPSLKGKNCFIQETRKHMKGGKERKSRVQKGARRGLDVKLSLRPATKCNDTHKITLDPGTGKQQPHLDQFAITERLD